MTKKIEVIAEENRIRVIGVQNSVHEFLAVASNYHKPVENSAQEIKPDYSHMQGSHYWVN